LGSASTQWQRHSRTSGSITRSYRGDRRKHRSLYICHRVLSGRSVPFAPGTSRSEFEWPLSAFILTMKLLPQPKKEVVAKSLDPSG
jgi:hypothetical protein